MKVTVLGICLALAAAQSQAATPAASDVTAINVLLEVSQTLSDRAEALNQRLRMQYPDGFALDATHVPHLTVLQRHVRTSELDEATAAIAAVVAHPGVAGKTLTATGVYASSFAGLGMANIAVSPDPELLRLQEELIVALAPFVAAEGGADAFVPEPAGKAVNDATVAYVRDFVPKSSGKNYKPHVTVGVADQATVDKLTAAPFTPVRFSVTTVAIYQLGNFCTARRLIWRSGDR